MGYISGQWPYHALAEDYTGPGRIIRALTGLQRPSQDYMCEAQSVLLRGTANSLRHCMVSECLFFVAMFVC